MNLAQVHRAHGNFRGQCQHLDAGTCECKGHPLIDRNWQLKATAVVRQGQLETRNSGDAHMAGFLNR